MEKTLVLLKPDAVQRGLVGEIISRVERAGLKIVAMKMQYAGADQAGKHYADDEAWMKAVGEKTQKTYAAKGLKMARAPIEHGRMVREQLIDFLSLSPIISLVIEGHNAVAHVRKIAGATSPEHAAPGTVRGDYSMDTYQLADTSSRPLQNLIHASESAAEAKREINVWFNPDEIYVWKRVDEHLLYRGLK
ncbi:nucleoside-diphosphate kinase [Candidatus Woesearchaeota archaeon]|nr:nucleoside-diphosphate kinase [Candidatus Woesearchaeota archaeon]